MLLHSKTCAPTNENIISDASCTVYIALVTVHNRTPQLILDAGQVSLHDFMHDFDYVIIGLNPLPLVIKRHHLETPLLD